MFCPVCRDEYRPGFTRCATCDVALVEAAGGAAASAAEPSRAVSIRLDEPFVNFCGFLTLEEAREARDKVRAAGRPAEILIRDAPQSLATDPVHEEYWLRGRANDFKVFGQIVGFAPEIADLAEDSFTCSACGATVQAADTACPGCGLRFDG
jgi:hypothetical protein